MILVGDVGGTHVRLGLAQHHTDGRIAVTHFRKIIGDDIAHFDDAVDQFLGEISFTPRHVSIALAGPVKDGAVQLTNRDWFVSAENLSTRFGFGRVELFNDFKAMARCVPEVQPGDFRIIRNGPAEPGEPILVAGAGTGFGVAKLVQLNDKWHVFGSEGGHVAFAAQTPKETELLHILKKTHDFISVELITSGWGMDIVHAAICEQHNVPYRQTSPADILELAAKGDVISLELCQLRSQVIMGALGDMTMITGAKGGVVLAGGVSERLIDYIDTPDAISRFLERGSMSDYLKPIPIKLLQNPAAPLVGAAALYQDHCS